MAKENGSGSTGNSNRGMGMAVFQQTEIHHRDVFISWIRGEFAAANAIIDALCNHMRMIGEPGEYDSVIACIQQRRYNWISVLQMQQYFSVADVASALQQVASKKQRGGNSNGFRNAQIPVEFNEIKSVDRPEIEANEAEDDEVLVSNQGNDAAKGMAGSENNNSNISEKNKGSYEERWSNGYSQFLSKQEEDRQKQARIKATKSFVANELVEGHNVNIAKGLKLYENIFDSSELSQLTCLVHELQVAGQKGELRGQTFMASKRPMKGNGREMIQFGVPIHVGHLKEATNESVEDVVEPIPKVLQAVIDRLLRCRLMPGNRRPDCCIINFFSEGDHSQPHISPPHFERPFYTLSLLSECIMVFGRAIAMDDPGDYKGSLKLSLAAGSLLVMQGNSADISRHAICSSPRKRIMVTFVKIQPKKAMDSPNLLTSIPHPPSLSMIPSPESQQSSGNTQVRPHSQGRALNPAALKHYNLVPASGVLPVPLIPQHVSAAGIRPLFTGLAGYAGAYPPVTLLAPGCSVVPRLTRMPSPGTGVFLPCSGSASSPGWPVSAPQQQQGVLVLSHFPLTDSPITTIASAESPGSSRSTSGSSKSTLTSQLQFDHLDRSSENSNPLSLSHGSPGSMDSTGPSKATGKDIMDGSPKLDSNGNGISKDDQAKRSSSWSKTRGNKANSIAAGGTDR